MMAMRSDSILVPNGVFTKTMNDSNDGFLFFFHRTLRTTDDTNQKHVFDLRTNGIAEEF
jgi:hypothetical protein